MVPDKRDTSAFTLPMISPQIPSRANQSNHLPSTKNEYSRLKRGRHVVATSQLTIPLCVKNLSVSRRKKLHDVGSVNVTRPRLREVPLRARGLKDWCSYGGSEKYVSYPYIPRSLLTEPFDSTLVVFPSLHCRVVQAQRPYHHHYLNYQSIRIYLHDLLVASARQ